MISRRAGVGLALVAGILAATQPGCSASDGRVAGVVTVAGKPAAGGTISFVAPGTGSAFTARIEPDGSFELRGVPPGEMIVLVFGPPPNQAVRADPLARQKMAGGQYQAEAPPVGPPIPHRYSQPATSPFVVSVTPGRNQVPIDLVP